MKIKEAVLYEYIVAHNGVTIKQLANHFQVTAMTIHRHVRSLQDQKKILKQGKAPHVRIIALDNCIVDHAIWIRWDIHDRLQHNWYQISKTGKELKGVSGFATFCKERTLEILWASQRWYSSMQFIDSNTTMYGIDATQKLHDYGHEILEHLRYGSIYALPEFGKTKQWTRMEIAKVQPNLTIFGELMQVVQGYVKNIIRDYAIDALCFVQPTAKRPLQIMKYAEKVLHNDLPILPLYKMPGYFPAQKTLKKREERIANADASFGLDYFDWYYDHVLIIDDAVGSGATLVEIGRKLLNSGKVNKVSACAITGTANGIFEEFPHFEVLANV
jgi:hypothetical protein